ncbi:MAG: TatD family hydrolase [Candidatus Aminicenantes bacterium]|nr:TatD family hydrolase [Candidatus Aminicenantes bacterium]
METLSSPGAAERFGLVDSHAHLDMEAFARDRDEVVARAFQAGLESVLCPAELTEERSAAVVLDLVRRHPRLLAAAGVHPHRAALYGRAAEDALRRLAAGGEIRAVGEIGLDFHYNLSPPSDQSRAFRAQLGLAAELRLPVILHSRDAGPEVLDAVREANLSRGGVLHCFTESWPIAARALDLGLHISFSGILTFPGATDLRETARRIPDGRLLVETDAPYLAPVPYRGKGRRNEPAWVVETARLLAGLRNVPFEELADATTRTYCGLFGFEKSRTGC